MSDRFRSGYRYPVLLGVVLVFIFAFCGCFDNREVISLTEVSTTDTEDDISEAGDVQEQTGGASASDGIASDAAEGSVSGETASGSSGSAMEDAGADDDDDSGDFVAVQLLAVHVCGAVMTPGVYYLPADSRVCDAIEAAGGLSEDASDTSINQAALLADGMQILVPTKEEVSADGTAGGITYAQDSGNESTDTSSTGELVNINTATRDELMELPGIGEAKADAIIAYREENGDFASTEEIMNVSGIKEASYAKLEDKITVG